MGSAFVPTSRVTPRSDVTIQARQSSQGLSRTERVGRKDPNVYRLPAGNGTERLELRLRGRVSDQDEGTMIEMLVDTGSMVSLVGRRLASKWPRWGVLSRTPIRLADGTPVRVGREGLLKLEFREYVRQYRLIEVDLEEDLILGMDFLEATAATIDVGRREITLGDGIVTMELHKNAGEVKSVGQLRRASVDKMEKTMDKEEIVEEIKLEFPGIFGNKGAEFGRTTWVKHKIYTGDAVAIKQRPRRLSARLWEAAKAEVEKMAKLGVIERSESPWCSPVVLVNKKDGEIRFCVDYRRVNEVTKKDSYPLPNLTEMLSCLGEATWFSVLDLRSGYWQIEMTQEDKDKTAFSIGTGLWQFTVMPFGLSNAVATFQRLMERTLAGLVPGCCMVYVDDIIVYGKSKEESLANLRTVMKRLTEAGLTLSEKKCHFLQREVRFLGHMVSSQEIAMDVQKIDAVRSWPIP